MIGWCIEWRCLFRFHRSRIIPHASFNRWWADREKVDMYGTVNVKLNGSIYYDSIHVTHHAVRPCANVMYDLFQMNWTNQFRSTLNVRNGVLYRTVATGPKTTSVAIFQCFERVSSVCVRFVMRQNTHCIALGAEFVAPFIIAGHAITQTQLVCANISTGHVRINANVIARSQF